MEAVFVSEHDKRAAYGSGDYITCGLCALWIERKEDSISVDMGICPRKLHPHCLTNRNDGCRAGVMPRE